MGQKSRQRPITNNILLEQSIERWDHWWLLQWLMALWTICEAGQQVNYLTFQSDHSYLCALYRPWSFTAIPYLIVIELKSWSCLGLVSRPIGTTSFTTWNHHQSSQRVLQWPVVFGSLDSHGFYYLRMVLVIQYLVYQKKLRIAHYMFTSVTLLIILANHCHYIWLHNCYHSIYCNPCQLECLW